MLRWLVAFELSLVIFSNHYTRDVVGALEKQMESDLGISTVQYAMMNSLFFGPNIISPILAGVAIKRFGNPALCFLVVSLMAGELKPTPCL